MLQKRKEINRSNLFMQTFAAQMTDLRKVFLKPLKVVRYTNVKKIFCRAFECGSFNLFGTKLLLQLKIITVRS